MSLELDSNNSRRLGVGERINAGVFARPYFGDLEWAMVGPADYVCGSYVTDDSDLEYREYLMVEGADDQTPMDTFETGSIRQCKIGKGRYDLIPLEGMRALAMRYEDGAAAHGDRNWELGQPLSVFKNSMTRHACQVAYDFSEDHAAAVAWNAFGYITTMERIRAGLLPASLDDLSVCNKEPSR
jgi:hypothetical protein